MTALARPPMPAPAAVGEPTTLAALGIDPSIVLDLALKTLFYRGRLSRSELSNELKLSRSVTDEAMALLSQDSLAAILGAAGDNASGYIYTLTDKGRERAEKSIERSGYVGAVPVALGDYIAQVYEQSITEAELTRERLRLALGTLVLSEATVARLGRATASRRSTLVYGPSGNGKTTAVNAIARAVSGVVRIPYAIDVVGHIVHLYDPSKHEIADKEHAPTDVFAARPDRRWVSIRRPVIWAGGELTKQSLEFVYDDTARVYEAPLQLKANGGTLIIDDFGRQQIPAVQLLNRWITALEGGTDHLTLHTGQTIETPFDVMVLFSTNLAPQHLADDAFLRRIRYKIEIPDPSEDEYYAIFERECRSAGIAYDRQSVEHLVERWYREQRRPLRGCHPRDLLDAVADACVYERRTPELAPDLLDEVCATYFLHPLQTD